MIAVIGPAPAQEERVPFTEFLAEWRERSGVVDWPDDDPWADVRDPSPGPPSPW